MWTWTSSTVATLTTLATLATALAAMATRLTIAVWRIHTQAHSERTAAAARLSLKLTVYLTDYARNSPGRGHLTLFSFSGPIFAGSFSSAISWCDNLISLANTAR